MKRFNFTLLALLACMILAIITTGCDSQSMTTVSSTIEDGISIIYVEGAIDKTGCRSFIRKLEEAEEKAQPVIIVINCPGGEISSSIELCESLSESKTPTYSLVKEAIATGLWISLSTDEIYFLPEGIAAGSNLVVDAGNTHEIDSALQKVKNYTNDFLMQVAEQKERDPKLIFALTDTSESFAQDGKDWKQAGEALVLNASEAKDIGLSKGTVNSISDLADLISTSEASSKL